MKENHPRDVAEVSVPIQDGNKEYYFSGFRELSSESFTLTLKTLTGDVMIVGRQ